MPSLNSFYGNIYRTSSRLRNNWTLNRTKSAGFLICIHVPESVVSATKYFFSDATNPARLQMRSALSKWYDIKKMIKTKEKTRVISTSSYKHKNPRKFIVQLGVCKKWKSKEYRILNIQQNQTSGCLRPGIRDYNKEVSTIRSTRIGTYIKSWLRGRRHLLGCL